MEMAVHTTRIDVRCSPEEKALWSEKAKAAGLGLSEWLRSVANAGEVRQEPVVRVAKGRPVPRTEAQEDAADAAPTLQSSDNITANAIRTPPIWQDKYGNDCHYCGAKPGKPHARGCDWLSLNGAVWPCPKKLPERST